MGCTFCEDNTNNPSPVLFYPSVSPNVADIVVLLDGSASVKKQDFEQFKDFVKLLANPSWISEKNVHLSVMEFSDDARVVIPLNRFYDVTELRSAIDRLQASGGSSRTDIALEKAWGEGFAPENGARVDAPKILILVTDGKSSGTTQLKNAVMPLRQNGVAVHVVAIGDGAGEPSLVDVATRGSYVETVGRPDHVTSVLPSIIRKINKNLEKGMCRKLYGVKQMY